MGGLAFRNTRRIHVSELDSILKDVSRVTKIPKETLNNNLLGSTGKQKTSGDVDIAIDSETYNISEISLLVRSYVNDQNISTKTLSGGEFQSSWPIPDTRERVQVDFISGDVEWLKFSHYSPGKYLSPYKGVYMTTLFGVLAKINKDFEAHSPEGFRFARVGWELNTFLGLQRVWRLQCKKNENTKTVDPDFWETNFDKVAKRHGVKIETPRFARTGLITEPEAIIRILYQDPDMGRYDVKTFEQAWQKVQEQYPERLREIKERVMFNLTKKSSIRQMTETNDLEKLDIWKDV